MKYLEGAYNEEVLLLYIFDFRNLQDNLTLIHIYKEICIGNLYVANSIKLSDSNLPISCTHHVIVK